jgi:crossover junction endodeoxyribonuclease RuvC
VSVLGIDPGLAVCGYGVVEREGAVVRALEHGSWTTRPREPLAERLLVIHEAVAGLIEQYRPEAAALEDSYVGADARVALAVGQARGAVMVACARAGVPCTEYSPATVKQAVCGYGRADKAQVQRMVRTILRLETDPQPHHAADALAVAICHAHSSPAVLGARR